MEDKLAKCAMNTLKNRMWSMQPIWVENDEYKDIKVDDAHWQLQHLISDRNPDKYTFVGKDAYIR